MLVLKQPEFTGKFDERENVVSRLVPQSSARTQYFLASRFREPGHELDFSPKKNTITLPNLLTKVIAFCEINGIKWCFVIQM